MTHESPPDDDRPGAAVQSSAISVWRPHVTWSSLAVVAAVVATEFSDSLIVALAFWVTLELGHRLWRASEARSRMGLVRSHQGAIEIQRGGRWIRLRVGHPPEAWILPEDDRLVLAIAIRGGIVSIELDHESRADSLLSALRIDPDQQRVGTTLTATPVWRRRRIRRWLASLWPDQLSSVLIIIGFFAVKLGLPSIMAPWMFWGGWLIAALVRAVAPNRVVIGRDGVALSGPMGKTFLGYEHIRSVRASRSGVALSLTDGDVVTLPFSPRGSIRWLIGASLETWAANPVRVRARRDVLVAQIHLALSRWRTGATADAARLVERGHRSIAEWRESLDRLGSGAYREAAADEELLLEVLESPRSTLEQRVGTVLALRTNPEPQVRRRIQAVIDSSTSPRLRVALDKAQHGTLDEADLLQVHDETTDAPPTVSRSRSG